MSRILCWLGFHKWGFVQYIYFADLEKDGIAFTRKRCEREKCYAMTKEQGDTKEKAA